MEEEIPRIEIPSPTSDAADKMVFLQEQLVRFLSQYSMPLLEASLVFSKYTRQLTVALTVHAETSGEVLPEILAEAWPLLGHEGEASPEGPALESLLDNLDEDRMDILDTILRTAMTETEMPLADALLQLRQWEHLVRSQLATAAGTGQLFSPLEIPDDW